MTAVTTAEMNSVGELYPAQIQALVADYHRTVNTIMTRRYGPDWATSGDLPDEAYTAETEFHQWLNDLLDHIEKANQQALAPPS